ncbi:acireductone synthase [Spirulina sp. CCNP1310]|uniref:acireductone synthase n=1 Tax=Spirulina sp. CCNP1310 TaxID=3110249 RepID=UPI002B212D28|nr:acireductone synthase [Spirulina sp. CCNP1310]MEA5420647.1 acireductone synthase [Spirulina sp. CCNP1310]
MIQGIITDIEGTTTAIDFVFNILFPYFREQLPQLGDRTHQPEILAILEEVQAIVEQEEGQRVDLAGAIATLHQWSVADRKIAPLKALQGIIWQQGYQNGDFQGHIYADVPPQLAQWQAQGVKLGIYSSGSVAAQKLLFSYSTAGDLTPYFDWYFDLAVGSKKEVTSYQTIATTMGIPPAHLLFLSDVEAELDAAQGAGFQTVQLVRGETVGSTRHPTATSFAEIILP